MKGVASLTEGVRARALRSHAEVAALRATPVSAMCYHTIYLRQRRALYGGSLSCFDGGGSLVAGPREARA